MIQKKICLLGAFAVGKTSLVSRYVHSIFSEKYHTTVGVKIDKKTVATADGRDVNLVIWDLAGEDELVSVRTSYLRGAAGYLLVVDGTRRATLDTALSLRERVEAELGPLPHIAVLNKIDRVEEWELTEDDAGLLATADAITIRTSAKTGVGVEDAFSALASRLLEDAT